MQDIKERGGWGVPNWHLYYYSSALLWIKEWMTLKNQRLLNLEGFDLQIGWHAFLWDEKKAILKHSYFERHTIRKSLIKIWEVIRDKTYRRLPKWISPIEAITHPNFLDPEKIITYQLLLDEKGELKHKKI